MKPKEKKKIKKRGKRETVVIKVAEKTRWKSSRQKLVKRNLGKTCYELNLNWWRKKWRKKKEAVQKKKKKKKT